MIDSVLKSMRQPETNLRTILYTILQSLENNVIPSAETVDELRKAFELYFSSYNKSGEVLVLTDVLSEAEIEQLVAWGEQVPSADDDIFFDDSFLHEKENIELLKRLVHEKIVPPPTGQSKEFIDYLISFGYVTSVTVQEEQYLLLTANGWQWIMFDFTQEVLLSEDPTFIIPAKLVSNVENWQSVELFSLVQLRKYYKKLGVDKFLVYEKDSTFWACEVQSAYAPRYCVPVLNNRKSIERELSRIKELCLSADVERITLLVQSNAAKNTIKAFSGADENALTKLHFNIMTEEDKP